MDARPERMSEELSQSSVLGQVHDDSAVGPSGRLVACALCHRFLSSNDGASVLEPISICGDCILEDLGTTIQDDFRLRAQRLRRRYHSSDSIENHFSQQFSHMINQARQNQAAVFTEHDNHSVDGDAVTMVVQHSSSRTTPTGSRRWRRVLSDPESDVHDSLYGDSESNFSFSGPRYFFGESDTISYSAYGGDSDTSVDGHSFLENENYIHQDGLSDPDSGTDIDPMNAGLYHWNSDDPEEDDEDEENTEWEETDAEESTVASLGLGAQFHRPFNSSESNVTSDWRQILSPHIEGTVHLTLQERRQGHSTNAFANFEVAEVYNDVGSPGDYLDARGFEELLEHLAETESSRKGAPPAAVSIVDNLPRLVIGEDNERLDVCAICKDTMSVGTVVNQLPCFHLYHPSCILPWLSVRNSCPICRYELPTDDVDYEDRKHRGSSSILDAHEIQQQDINEDGSSDITDDTEAEFSHNGMERGDLDSINIAQSSRGGSARRRWLFLAAATAPIVGIVSIALVFCLGNPITRRRWPSSHNDFNATGWHPNHFSQSRSLIQRNNGRSRRWWFPF